MGVDWGERRIGLALSDESQTLAQPLVALTRRAGKRFPMRQFLTLLDRRLADRRIYPAIDIQRTSTRKEELLMDKDELNRVYLLRNFLADMPPVEALEFLLERMKRTKNNKEFFATMAQ